MARKACINFLEVQRAKQLRDQIATVNDNRKVLLVALVAEHSLDADRSADVVWTSRGTIFCKLSTICNKDDTPKKM
jgi:hypothetical protein